MLVLIHLVIMTSLQLHSYFFINELVDSKGLLLCQLNIVLIVLNSSYAPVVIATNCKSKWVTWKFKFSTNLIHWWYEGLLRTELPKKFKS